MNMVAHDQSHARKESGTYSEQCQTANRVRSGTGHYRDKKSLDECLNDGTK